MKRILSVCAFLLLFFSLDCYANDYYITTRITITGYQAISPTDRWIVTATGSIEVGTSGTVYIAGQLIFQPGSWCQHYGYMSVESGGIVNVQTDSYFSMWGSMTVQSNGLFDVDSAGYLFFSDPATISSGGTLIADGDVYVGGAARLTVEGTLDIPVNGKFETGGITEIINGGVSNVTGRHTIIPGGYLNVYDQSTVNINPKGIVELNAGLSILRMFQGAYMHLISDLSDHAEIIIHDRAIVNMFDSTETVTIDDGSFILFETTASQFAVSSWGDGIVESYESHPFRGTGSLHRLKVNFYQDFIVAPEDSLIFKYGATITFLNPNATISIQSNTAYPKELGYLEFRGVVGEPAYNISGTVTKMNVADEATFKVSGAGTVGSLPEITAGYASILDFAGISSGRTAFEFIPVTGGITTEGILTATNVLFHGPVVPGWTGIHVIGPGSKVVLDTCAILEFNDAIGLHLTGSNNYGNLIRKSEIIKPIMIPFVGKGLFLDLGENMDSSYIRVKCCHIHGCEIAVHNRRGSLWMQQTSIVGDSIGVRSDSAESTITQTCVLGSFGNGITVDGQQIGSGFNMFNSRIYKNQGLQVELLNDANATIANSAVFYDIGDNTTCLVRTYGTSVATMTNNWWGVFPITPPMFDAQGYSTIDTNGALQNDLASFNCDCSIWSKMTTPVVIAPDDISVRNYPNPFNPSTVIEYTVPADMPVTLNVYTVAGALVSTLVDETVQAGTHRVTFTAPASGSSGLYLYELSTPTGVARGRMMLMK